MDNIIVYIIVIAVIFWACRTFYKKVTMAKKVSCGGCCGACDSLSNTCETDSHIQDSRKEQEIKK